MTVTERIKDEQALCEHRENGVETGFDASHHIVISAKTIGELAAGWKEARRLDVVLCRAIASLSQRFPVQAESGFDPWEVAEEIGEILGRKWAVGDSREVVSDKVRAQWVRLSDTWAIKREGVQQAFEQRKLATFVEPDRVGGGGQGNPTLYRLLPRPIQEACHSGRAISGQNSVAVENGRVAGSLIIVEYVCEDLAEASYFARIFSNGFKLAGWRRWLIASVLCGGILGGALAPLLFALALMAPQSLTKLVYFALSLCAICYALWTTLGSLLMLHRWRVTLAPWWMQSAEDDRLLEWRCPPRFEAKSIKAARYTGDCPLCGGKVVVRSGGLRLLWRLVGRCEEAPSAHIFSFDHVLRKGDRVM